MTPGEGEHARGELELADQALRAGRLLLGANALEDATSRLYYAAFHAAGAALMVNGLYAKTHAGQVDLFEPTFGDARFFRQLFEWRLNADYPRKRTFSLSADDAAGVADEAARFVERCRVMVAEFLTRGPDEPDPHPDL